MKTQLIPRSDTPSEPASSNVFGIVSSALARTSRRLGCWDANRLGDGSHRMDIVQDNSVTPDNLVYALAAG